MKIKYSDGNLEVDFQGDTRDGLEVLDAIRDYEMGYEYCQEYLHYENPDYRDITSL